MPPPSSVPYGYESSWHQDTIYCEATCEPRDTYYEGSDDNDYEDARTRRLRYEAAGRRFLDGETPLILSATLKGPFDPESGWVNPWRSKNSRVSRGTGDPAHSTKGSKPQKAVCRTKSRYPQSDDHTQCHLPSPESLKQVSVESHPFLEDDDVARVQKWRNTVQPLDTALKEPWSEDEVASPTEQRPARKRQANDPDWLEKSSFKKRKTRIETKKIGASPQAGLSPASLDHIPKGTTTGCLVLQSSCVSKADYSCDELGAGDDFEDNPDSSPVGNSSQATTTAKRLSPKRAVWRSNGSDAVDSEDELAQDRLANRRAATTLSSPVSNRKKAQQSLKTMHASPCAQRHTTRSRKLGLIESVEPVPSHPSEAQDEDVAMGDADVDFGPKRTTNTAEIWHEDELCAQGQSGPAEYDDPVIMHTALEGRDSSPLSSVGSFDSETWSGISSGASEENLPTVSADSSHPIPTAEEEHASFGGPRAINGGVSLERAGEEEDVGEQGGDEEEEPKPTASDEGSLSDKLSEISEPSSAGSCIHVATSPISGSEASYEIPRSEACPFESTGAPDAQEPQSTTAAIGTAGKSETQGFEQQSADVTMEDEDEQPTVDEAAARDPEHPTEGEPNHLVNDSSPGQPVKRKEPSSPVKDETPTIEPETISTATGGEILPPISDSPSPSLFACSDPTSNGFSFRGVFQRLVPMGSWRRSLSKESENMGHDHVQIQLDDLPIEDGTNTGEPEHVLESTLGEETATDPQITPCEPPAFSTDLDRVVLAEETSAPNEDGRSEEPKDAAIASQDEVVPQTAASPQIDSRNESDGPAVEHPVIPEQLGHAKHATQGPEERVPEIADHEEAIPYTIEDNPAEERELGEDHPAAFPQAGSAEAAATPTGPSTPESQFLLQPFSAFMTPSPERDTRQQRKSTTGRTTCPRGVLVSALKTPWSAPKPGRRVSWAPLPGKKGPEVISGSSESAGVGPSVSESRERPASPPPVAAVEDLPTSKESDFQGHFNAVARRASEAPRRASPTDLQESIHSPESWDTAASPREDAAPYQAPLTLPEQMQEEDKSLPGVGDELDLTEQVFQDLEALLQPWDLDAELEQARKQPGGDPLEIGV